MASDISPKGTGDPVTQVQVCWGSSVRLLQEGCWIVFPQFNARILGHFNPVYAITVDEVARCIGLRDPVDPNPSGGVVRYRVSHDPGV